jgi:acyl-coenzyme A synthetase/AMP-(fatty) acid ligase
MSIKSSLAKVYAKIVVRKNQKWIENPIDAQNRTFRKLISTSENTIFGKDHDFQKIVTYKHFKENVPISTYEDLKPYIEQIINGESNVLWKGRPIYFAKTSGTTSGTKYIPISKESMPYHIKAAKHALLHYIYNTQNADFVKGKMIF